ncbi:MAG: hypothetical protein ACOH18_03960 [Candidatus Saccharimonadaceae bacterium]
MDDVGNGNFTPRKETTETQITLASNPRLVAQLEAKLGEYREREAERPDMSFDHPEYKALQLRSEMFKGDILAFVLTTASERDTAERPIELVEVAEAMEERFGYDLTAAKQAPVIFDARYGIYCHDQPDLFAQGGELNRSFSSAYWVIRSYTTGDRGGIVGGTGLLDVETE